MVAVYQELIKREGKWQYTKGGSGLLTAVVNRDSLVLGTYDPLANVVKRTWENPGVDVSNNTIGYYGDDSITSQSEGGNLTYSTASQTVANTMFYRRISCAAPDLVYINCFFWGSPTENIQSVTSTNASASNVTFIDCTFTSMAPQNNTAGYKGGALKVTFIRCHVYGVIDGLAPSAPFADMRVIQSGIHDLAYFSPDPGAVGGIKDNAGHVDGIQMVGGSIRIQGSGIRGYTDQTKYEANEPSVEFGPDDASGLPPWHMFGNKYYPDTRSTSSMMWSPTNAPLTYVEVSDSYLDGGAVAPINGGGQGAGSGVPTASTDIQILRNKVGNDHRQNSSFYIMSAVTALQPYITVSGNVRSDTGAALTKAQLVANG